MGPKAVQTPTRLVNSRKDTAGERSMSALAVSYRAYIVLLICAAGYGVLLICARRALVKEFTDVILQKSQCMPIVLLVCFMKQSRTVMYRLSGYLGAFPDI